MSKKRSNKLTTKITFNSPVTLGFVSICFIALILNVATNGTTNNILFSVYRSSLANPLTYVRFFGHVFGHASWEHFINNMMYILLLKQILVKLYVKLQAVEHILKMDFLYLN